MSKTTLPVSAITKGYKIYLQCDSTDGYRLFGGQIVEDGKVVYTHKLKKPWEYTKSNIGRLRAILERKAEELPVSKAFLKELRKEYFSAKKLHIGAVLDYHY